MTMNEMLARLEAGDLRQREFVANASHELQSPLTSLRTQLEVALAHPARTGSTAPPTCSPTASGWSAWCATCCSSPGRRRDGRADRRLVDLDDVVLRGGRPDERPRPQVTADCDAAPVRGHADDLAPAGAQPAERHRHAASRVEVTLHTPWGRRPRGPGAATTGRGARRPREQVFQRFVRVDPSRRSYR